MKRIQEKMAAEAELKVKKAGVEGKMALKMELEAKGLGRSAWASCRRSLRQSA